MSNIIRLLPDHVANQIAAGEVVQRPASVVKELIENAVDAGATEVKLIVKEAGKTLIQVIDNGKGMSDIDSRMAFERHATSKITMAEDLFALRTKGFRGEALASIAAIAHVELKTCEEGAELGTHLVIEGSKLISQEEAVLTKGTSFSIKNLFFNIPARRNFLKSDTVEFRHVVDEFERVALAHPSVHFILIHNGSEMFNLPESNLRQRIVNVFGPKTNEKLVPINETTEIVSVEGFVGKPEFAKRSRGEQFFFVNDRFIKSAYLHHAVLNAFEGLLKEGTHPSYFLYLTLPTDAIDINIHPTKTEVKFDDEQALYAILRAAIKHSLGQFNVAPVLDFQRDATMDTPYEFLEKKAETPTIEVDMNYNPFKEGTGSMRQEYNPFEHDQTAYVSGGKSKSQSSGSFLSKSSFETGDKREQIKSNHTMYADLRSAANELDFSKIDIEEDVKEISLFDGVVEDLSTSRSFQLQRKYIVSPIKTGMVVIDQGRAHQRILYEKFLENFTVKQAASQQLLFPLTLYYSAYEVQLLKDSEAALKQTGFVFESIDKVQLVISGLPVNVMESEASIVLDELIQELQGASSEASFSLNDRIAKSLAHSLSVKTGTVLSEEEQENMVNSLFACKDPSVSPFLKPTFITMRVDDIEKRFAL